MGQSQSSALPSADPSVPYFSLTFQTPDKLTLALADESIVQLTREAIVDESSSTEGGGENHDSDHFLHYESRTEMNAYTFKFRGLPFMSGCGRANSFRASRMCCRILEKYAERGWRLILASDLSRAKELTTWFFTKVANDEETNSNNNNNGHHRRRVIAVSASGGDLLRLANAPESCRRVLTQAIRAVYSPRTNGIKSESVYEASDYELQLIETPWLLTEDAKTSIRTRRLLLEIIRRFDVLGYQFYGTANTKGTSDTLFFISSSSSSSSSAIGGGKSASPKPNLVHQLTTEESRYSYCAISLNFSNCLRVIEAPPLVVKSVLRAIVRYWPPKLAHQKLLDDRGTYEFKLRGNPWWETGGDEAIEARIFLCGLLETMKSVGWEPLTALDVSRRLNNKAVFVFRSRTTTTAASSTSNANDSFEDSKLHQQHMQQQLAFLFEDQAPPDPYWCLSMHEQSTIRLIGAPDEFRQAVRRTIDRMWPWGVHAETRIVVGPRGGCEFKLRSGPWGAEQQNTTALLCYILKTLNDQSCRVAISADVTGRYVSNNHGGAHSLDVHSWFLTTSASESSSGSESKDAANGEPAGPSGDTFSRLAQKRRSMPFLSRSATTDDGFLLMVEIKDRSAAPHGGSGSPAPSEKDVESKRGFSAVKKLAAKKMFRKTAAISECE